MPRGRKPGFRMTEAHRDKIRNSNILSCLIDHSVGKREMSSTQVTAGLGLLKKILPDVSSVELTGADGGPVEVDVKGMTDDQLLAIAAGGRKGAPDKA